MKFKVTKGLAGFLLWFFLGFSGTAFAGLVTLPPQLQPGDQYRLVFVSNGTMNASSHDIQDYNAFIQSQASLCAQLDALGTDWRVIGSTSDVDAKDNIAAFADVPIYNMNAELVALSSVDLWDGTLVNPINFDIYGNELNGPVFTGTGSDGKGIASRQLGGPSGYRVQYGYSSGTGASWTNSGDWTGTLNLRYFYGISDVLTVTAVPVPGSLVLLCSALAILIGYKSGKRG